MESEGIFSYDAAVSGENRRSGFSQHDDRTNNSGYRRGGTGGRWRRGSRGRGRGGRGSRGGVNPRTKLQEEDDDGDVSMEDSFNRRGQRDRYRPYSNRQKFEKSPTASGGSVFSRLGEQGSSAGGVFGRLSGLGGQKFTSRGDSWHKISIPNGQTQNREWLVKKLQQAIQEPFQPVQVHNKGERLMFFIQDGRVASKLKRLGQIDCRDGSLSILVKPSPAPKGIHDSEGSNDARDSWTGFGKRGGSTAVRRHKDGDEVMEEDPSQIIKQVLGQRYDPSTKSLDLSNMFKDPTLQASGIRASMYDKEFVSTILNLIGEHCPDLLSLDLSNNRLQRLQLYSELHSRCTNLRILDLSENQIRSPVELEQLSGMTNLHTLVLENNPLSEYSQNVITFANKLRKLFPNLQLLDGQELPSPVKFDVPVAIGQLPPSEKNYLVNDEVKGLVIAFLEQYYTIYDGESREKLLEAYANDAVLSISVNIPASNAQRGPSLQKYIPLSRNLKRVNDPGKRLSLLKHGRIDIVQFLRDLPKTKHHPGTFAVDVIRATPISTAFVVYGVFNEVGESQPVRTFTRTFVLSATGNGVVIVNDQLTIQNANTKSVQYVREKRQEGQPSPQVGDQVIPSTMQKEREMLFLFAQKTGMNHEWCTKCLEQNNWDIQRAELVFNLLQSQGKIPQEAFNS